MNKLPTTAQDALFNFACGEIDSTTFQDYLNTNRSYLTYLGATLLTWLQESDFETTEHKAEIIDKLSAHIELDRFELHRINVVLNALINKTDRFIEALYQSYELYADGYFFMETVGVQHGLSFSNTYFDYFEWEKLPESAKKSSISTIYPSVRAEATKIKQWLDHDKIKVTGKKDGDGLYTYIDIRNDIELLNSFDDHALSEKRPTWLNLFKKTRKKFQLIGYRSK
jgi:hypothetical protein